jgi:REP element-mobilizing transposase RayT
VANQIPQARLGEKLTPVVESKILKVCATKQYQTFVARAAVDHMHVLLGMRLAQAAVSDVVTLKSNSSAAAFATFSRLDEIIKMDVLWAEGNRADSVSPGESTKRASSGKIQISSEARCETRRLGRGRAARRDCRPDETPTAHAVGIGCEFRCPTTGSRQWLGWTVSRPYPRHIAVVRNAQYIRLVVGAFASRSFPV